MWNSKNSQEFCALFPADDNIDETYGVNVQFESDEEVGTAPAPAAWAPWGHPVPFPSIPFPFIPCFGTRRKKRGFWGRGGKRQKKKKKGIFEGKNGILCGKIRVKMGFLRKKGIKKGFLRKKG